MKHYVYKITNEVNGKIYVGVHSTENPDDGYMGSGVHLRKAIKKYGMEHFKKELIVWFDTMEEAYTHERIIVNREFVSRRDTYNSEIGGRGGKVWTPELRDKMSKTQKKRYFNNPSSFARTPMSDERKAEMSNIMTGKLVGEKNPMYGVRVRDLMSEDQRIEHSRKISEANSGKVRTEEHKKNYSEAAKRRRWIVHRDGTLKTTSNPDDERFNHPDWRRGKKWKE